MITPPTPTASTDDSRPSNPPRCTARLRIRPATPTRGGIESLPRDGIRVTVFLVLKPLIEPRIGILCALGLLTFAWNGVAQYVQEGEIAREFSLAEYRTDNPIRLSDFSESILVIDFFRWW